MSNGVLFVVTIANKNLKQRKNKCELVFSVYLRMFLLMFSTIAMKSILITGANRGLGLGMVKYLAKKKSVEHIFATCRNTECQELKQLATENKNIHMLQLEIFQTSTFDGISNEVSAITKDQGLNVLINNAGVTTKFTKIGLVKKEQLLDNYLVNVVGPILLTKSFVPLLKSAAKTNDSMPMGIDRAAVVNMSSILGSIASNDQGGFYPYRCSKAAVNAATRSMALDFKNDGILVVSIHPGWAKTDMGGKNAPVEVETSVTQMFQTLQNLSVQQSGKFYQYDGEELPW